MATDCPFCGIADGRIPAKKIFENETVVAFLDINPRNPGHTLVIPKNHYETIFDIPAKEAGEVFAFVKTVADAVKNGSKADGLSITQSNYRAAGQVVPHLHFHLIPRFDNEGPVGLEGFMPVKKMDDDTMERITQSIKQSVSEDYVREEQKKPGKKSGKKEELEDDDKDEEIDFNF